MYKKLKIFIILYYRKFSRAILFPNAYFFDTNMIVSNSPKDSRFCKLFTLSRRYYLAEKNNEEVDILLKTDGYRLIGPHKFNVFSFEDLRKRNPEICPVYYNFIQQMNNPAVPFSPNFFSSRMTAVLTRNGKLSKEDDKIQKKVSMMLKEFNDGVDKAIKNTKRQSPLLTRDLPESSDTEFYKKKRKAITENDPNYFNDLRSLSLAICYCLQYEENTTYITADSDIMNLFFSLIEAVCYQCMLKVEILPLLTEEMKEAIVSGKEIEFDINIWKITGERIKMAKDLHSNFKKKSFLFRVKFWSIKEQRYYNIDTIFSEPQRMLFLNSSGPFMCPYGENPATGNWLRFKYFFPYEDFDTKSQMKLIVSRKSLINIKNIDVSEEVHNKNCHAFQQDKNNNFKFFLTFSDTAKF